jgi:hypothetical protein
MTGLNALLFIQGRMHDEGILGDTIIAVFLVQILEKVLVEEVIRVNMHTECLNAGCILVSIELGFAKMVPVATDECVSLLILQKSFVPFMFPLAQPFRHRGLLDVWICLV